MADDSEDDEPYPLTVGEFKMLLGLAMTSYRTMAMIEFRSRARAFKAANGAWPTSVEMEPMIERAVALTTEMLDPGPIKSLIVDRMQREAAAFLAADADPRRWN